MGNEPNADRILSPMKTQLQLIDNFLNKPSSLRRPHRAKNNKIAFAISLKSKKVSRNWGKVQVNLARTLRSILRSTDRNFLIVIAGHEKPNIPELRHKRVTWLEVKFAPPSNAAGFTRDKMRKRKVIGAYLRKSGFSGYFMPLDADDWIHRRFVEYVRSRPRANAFILKSGFMANMSQKQMWFRKDRFYIGCGSSAVFYLSNKDLPKSSKSKKLRKIPFQMTLKAHPKVMQHLSRFKKKYKLIKLPFVTWVLAHGDNNSMIKGKKDNKVAAKNYRAIEEPLKPWIYKYFKIRRSQ